VELTCTRAICHVIYVVSGRPRAATARLHLPKCGRGVLELRDHAAMTLR
jgi:hypothetical protein